MRDCGMVWYISFLPTKGVKLLQYSRERRKLLLHAADVVMLLLILLLLMLLLMLLLLLLLLLLLFELRLQENNPGEK